MGWFGIKKTIKMKLVLALIGTIFASNVFANNKALLKDARFFQQKYNNYNHMKLDADSPAAEQMKQDAKRIILDGVNDLLKLAENHELDKFLDAYDLLKQFAEKAHLSDFLDESIKSNHKLISVVKKIVSDLIHESSYCLEHDDLEGYAKLLRFDLEIARRFEDYNDNIKYNAKLIHTMIKQLEESINDEKHPSKNEKKAEETFKKTIGQANIENVDFMTKLTIHLRDCYGKFKGRDFVYEFKGKKVVVLTAKEIDKMLKRVRHYRANIDKYGRGLEIFKVDAMGLISEKLSSGSLSSEIVK